MSATILVVEDELGIQEVLKFNLGQHGHDVVVAPDAEDALNLLRGALPDLILLDWMLPGMSGIDLARRIRSDARLKTIPIIMLTARAEERDKIQGLDTGADDYITKPFSLAEFRSRVKAALRRAELARDGDEAGDREPDEREIEAHEVRLDPVKRQVWLRGDPITTTFVEFELLLALASSPGRVFSREQILTRIWGDSDYRDPRTVDVHIRHLREKLERDPKDPAYLFTVRGVGYRFRDDGDPSGD